MRVQNVHGHIVQLDGLRGIAALSVAVLHLYEIFGLGLGPVRAILAVDFFFMLSGFVIGFAYETKLKAGLGVRRFAMVRLVRLYPMIFIGVSLGLVARLVDRQIAEGYVALPAIVGSALLAYALLPTPRHAHPVVSAWPIDSPLWSVSYELVANIAYAVVAPRLDDKLLVFFVAASAVALAATEYWFGIGVGIAWSPTLLLGFVRAFCPFAIGLLLYRRLGTRRAKSPVGPSGARAIAVSLLPGALLALLLWMPLSDERSNLFDICAVLVGFPLILLIAITVRADALAPIWKWFGAISYPFYAVHTPIFRLLAKLTQSPALVSGRGWVAAGGSFVVTIAIAEAIRRIYDEPLRARLSRRWFAREGGSATQSPRRV